MGKTNDTRAPAAPVMSAQPDELEQRPEGLSSARATREHLTREEWEAEQRPRRELFQVRFHKTQDWCNSQSVQVHDRPEAKWSCAASAAGVDFWPRRPGMTKSYFVPWSDVAFVEFDLVGDSAE